MQFQEQDDKRNKMKKALALLAVMIVIAAVIITVLLFKHEKESPTADVVPVNVYNLIEAPATQTVTVAGTTKSAERAVLQFQVSGRVSSKLVRLGDKVSSNQALIELYSPEIQPLAERASKSFEQANVRLSQAKRDYTRLNKLYKEQAVTQNEWEQSKTALESAESAVNVAQADVERTTRLADELIVNAPFSGVITQINVDEGESVQAGAVALQLSNPDAVELELALSNEVINKLSKGQSVVITPTFLSSGPVTGIISDISPFRERGALPQIVVSLPVGQIQPGAAVKAQLQIPSKSGLNVPIKAVVMTGENSSGVYVVDTKTSRVKLVAIRPLRIDNDSVLLEGALSYGDQIVVAGIAQLYDGAKVKIRQKANTTVLNAQQQTAVTLDELTPSQVTPSGNDDE